MKATFLGAAGTVTGSCTLLETSAGAILIDCGMYQGRREAKQLSRFTHPLHRIRCVILTHAHIDHSGLLPWLCQHGFAGPVYATGGTRDLCQILLADSARLQQEEAAYRARKGHRVVEPLYTELDVVEAKARFVAIEYNWPFEPLPGLRAEFFDAGHILGAASVALDGDNRTVVFSGDVGRRGRPLIRDPQPPPAASTVVTEATYGDRLQPGPEEAADALASAVSAVAQRGGVCVIPVFAVGRAQGIIYELGELMRARRIPRMPVFLDSPLAIEALAVFERHKDYFDQDTMALLAQGIDPLAFAELHTCRTVDESKALNQLTEPAIILAGSGMCTGGRVRHHLRVRLPNPQDAVLFVGYQAHGTLGRILVEGVDRVKLYGEWVPVNAEIRVIEGFSAHADREELLAWLSQIDGVGKVLINHAEPEAAAAYAEAVRVRLGLPVEPVELLREYAL